MPKPRIFDWPRRGPFRARNRPVAMGIARLHSRRLCRRAGYRTPATVRSLGVLGRAARTHLCRGCALAAFVDRLRGGPSQAQAIIHARQPTPDGGDQRDTHGLANLGKQYGGFSSDLRLIDCRYRIVCEVCRHAPNFSASSGKLTTTRSCRGSGSGSGGPSAPHSSGRRTKAVR